MHFPTEREPELSAIEASLDPLPSEFEPCSDEPIHKAAPVPDEAAIQPAEDTRSLDSRVTRHIRDAINLSKNDEAVNLDELGPTERAYDQLLDTIHDIGEAAVKSEKSTYQQSHLRNSIIPLTNYFSRPIRSLIFNISK